MARRRRRGRGFRRNPPVFSVRGITGMLAQGVQDAAGVVVGKAAARAIPATLNINVAGPAALAVQALAAVVAGYMANRFVNASFGRMVLAGGLAAPVESFVKSLNIPILSPALGDYYLMDGQGAYAIEGYPEEVQGTGAYPALEGDVADDVEYARAY